jgi:hypothetical protein
MVLVLALLLLLLPAGLVRADTGRPAGWAMEQATQQVIVGRMVLRYDPDLKDEALWLARQAPEWWSQMETALAGDVDDRLQVTLVDHSGQVAEATGMPRWVAGVAHSPSGEIAIARHAPDGSPTDLDGLLRHEMAHVVLYRATGGVALPRWFSEGVAESFTDEISLWRAQTLASAVFGPGVPPLRELEAALTEPDGQQAAVAYAATRDLVTYLRYRDEVGAKFRQVLAELRRGQPMGAAFTRAYGIGLEELVAEWRADLPGRFVWYPLVASGGLPFFLVGPLVAWAWLRRRRVLRASWERLAREEESSSPAGLLGPAGV